MDLAVKKASASVIETKESALITQLKADNKALAAELEEVNMVLSIREEELDMLRKQAEAGNDQQTLRAELEEVNMILSIREEEVALLKKQLEQLEEIPSGTGNNMPKHTSVNSSAGLQDSSAIYMQYAQLQQQFTLAKIKLEDALNQLDELSRTNLQLAQTARRVGELESRLQIEAAEKQELLNSLRSLHSGKTV